MLTCRVLFHPDSFGAGPQPVGPQPVRPLTGGPQPVIRPVNPAVSPSVPRPAPSGPVPNLPQPAGPKPVAASAAAGLPPEEVTPKIRAMDQKLAGGTKHEDNWLRSPNVTGTGAIHCKSFHCKLTGDALENLDRQINEWLDSHPQYEVKFVQTCVGEWLGKLKEPNLIVQVWV